MNEVFDIVEGATGLKKPQILQYGLVASVLLVMLGVGQNFITTMLGVCYPAFASFVALETEAKDDDKQWLTYWVCFGFFQIVDCFGGIILSFIPFYFFLKVGFMVWLFHPKTMGALWLYNNYLQAYVKQYRAQVEGLEKNIANQASGYTKEAKKVLNM